MTPRRRSARVHKAGPVGGPASGGWRAWCTCGWNGRARPTKWAAERDTRVHKRLAEAREKQP